MKYVHTFGLICVSSQITRAVIFDFLFKNYISDVPTVSRLKNTIFCCLEKQTVPFVANDEFKAYSGELKH